MDNSKGVTIIVPTLHAPGVTLDFLRQLGTEMHGFPYPWEVLVVDDSSDSNFAAMQAREPDYPWLKVHHREPARRDGFAGAVIYALNVASGRKIVIAKADGQHSPKAIRELIEYGWESGWDLLVSSRYALNNPDFEGGLRHHFWANIVRWLPQLLFPGRLWWLMDPASSLIWVTRKNLPIEKLEPGGLIALELALMSNWQSVNNLPYEIESARVPVTDPVQVVPYFRQLISLAWRYYRHYLD